MTGDFLWDIAISQPVLVALALLAVAAFLVGHIPVIGSIPAVAPYVVLARVAAIVFVAALLFLLGFRVDLREAKFEIAWKDKQIEDAEASAKDAQQFADQNKERADALQTEVDSYVARLNAAPAGACALDDADLAGLRAIGRAQKP
jgi:hypothetical protein